VKLAMGTPRCLLLVKSVHHGNTAKVAGAMAGVLGADIATPESAPSTSLAEYNLVGFGSGVYYGRMHGALLDWLRGLPAAPEPSAPAFIFSTSGLPFLAPLWHWPLRRLLARKGFRVVGAFACRGHDTWGPLWLTGGLNRAHPDERDLARAKKFAAEMGQHAQPSGAQPCLP
jgi:flavodoxin